VSDLRSLGKQIAASLDASIKPMAKPGPVKAQRELDNEPALARFKAAVDRLGECGWSWERIAKYLGCSKQNVMGVQSDDTSGGDFGGGSDGSSPSESGSGGSNHGGSMAGDEEGDDGEPPLRIYDRLGLRRARDPGARLVAYSDRSGDCWLWLGSLTRDGYGRTHVAGVDRLAHVVAYELHVGPVPEGLVLDHTCRVRRCINPAHLEPVPVAVNTARGDAPSAVTHRSRVCRLGHPIPDGGRCKVCHAAAQRAWYERKKAAASPARRGRAAS
jgi:hypothetical protein